MEVQPRSSGGRCANIKLHSILSAIVTRLVFALHCCIALWRIVLTIEWRTEYWALFSGLGALLVEAAITIGLRKGAEYKWFCPSVFFYLTTIVPCVWILELDQLQQRIDWSDNHQGATPSTGEINATQFYQQRGLAFITNISIVSQWEQTVTSQLNFEPAQWIVILEQLLLFLLILGRWMLPKGNISRDELSQLLLVYIGMAADIIEFFETFKEERVKTDWLLTVIIMSIWSASLLQFTLVLTASVTVKSRPGFQAKTETQMSGRCRCCCWCCGTEVFGMMTAVVLQDGPFLCLRMLLLIDYEVNSYMHIFFTVKNSLVLLLIVYRLSVICHTQRSEKENNSKSCDIEMLTANNHAAGLVEEIE